VAVSTLDEHATDTGNQHTSPAHFTLARRDDPISIELDS
jgi:hypothetical protein